MGKVVVILLAAVFSVVVAFPAEIVEDPNMAPVVRIARKATPQFGGLYVGLGGYNRYGGYGYGGYPGGYGGYGGYGYGGYPGGYGHHHHHHGYDGYHSHGGYGGHHHGGGHHHHG